MGWHEYYLRRDALDAVVEGGFTVPPGFSGPDEVLQALHHRWTMRLTGRLELALHDSADATDAVDAVGTAWLETVEVDPALRRLLDEHADHPALRAVTRAEHRMLARSAGLTDAGDDPDEQAAIGAAFAALLRTGPRNPVRRLLRRLAPSA
jgi:hypothetical protein